MYDKHGINDPRPGTEGRYSHKDYPLEFNKSSFLPKLVNQYTNITINTVLDIGALEGGDGLRFNSWYPNAKVYSIEGSPHNYNVMVDKLGVRENLEMFNYVMSSQNGMVDFRRVQYNDDRSKDGTMIMGSIYNYTEGKKRQHKLKTMDSVKVESVTFDRFCELNNITEVDIAHVDIEGATYDMVLGMNKILPKMLFAEQEAKEMFADKTTGGNNALLALLSEKGYEMVKNFGNDYLFVRRDILK
jgi:FkbM family methyltransferase